jgi:hypothetical protein
MSPGCEGVLSDTRAGGAACVSDTISRVPCVSDTHGGEQSSCQSMASIARPGDGVLLHTSIARRGWRWCERERMREKATRQVRMGHPGGRGCAGPPPRVLLPGVPARARWRPRP